MADAGIPLHVLQGILGHKSIETTRGYIHPDTRHLASAAQQANAFLDAQEQRQAPSRTSGGPRRATNGAPVSRLCSGAWQPIHPRTSLRNGTQSTKVPRNPRTGTTKPR
ncbi:tyrosine-type recombinase/integrase [Microbacterium algeriense]|uniref:tyrosine-type recombinase/integrase n=1 Tax=Microbacterium algeriense TaxID=2615184 RepID=UPI0022E0715B|nr:tyrosine-type recombinase/integrase [Microbacterium algeriense]